MKPEMAEVPLPATDHAAEGHRLPPQPDFDAIEARAGSTSDQRGQVLRLVGDLNFAWANNESLLIYLMMLLLRTDQISAAVVFATLNTTRARLDLVERLAMAHLPSEAPRQALEAAMQEFTRLTKVRNDMNHCIFVVGPEGELSHTQTLKLEERRGRLSFGARRAIDDKRLAELSRAAARLKELNRELWRLLPRLEAAIGRGG